MKRILIVALMLLALAGCKKREDAPVPNQVAQDSLEFKIVTQFGVYMGHKLQFLDSNCIKFVTPEGMVITASQPWQLEIKGQ